MNRLEMPEAKTLINTVGGLALVYLVRKAWQSLQSVPAEVSDNKGLTVFKFFFSPPARFVHVTTLLCKVPNPRFIDIDLYNADQLQWWFLRVNPNHQGGNSIGFFRPPKDGRQPKVG